MLLITGIEYRHCGRAEPHKKRSLARECGPSVPGRGPYCYGATGEPVVFSPGKGLSSRGRTGRSRWCKREGLERPERVGETDRGVQAEEMAWNPETSRSTG